MFLHLVKETASMKYGLIFLLLCCATDSFGTAQVPDFLIYKGDTLSIFSNPLEASFSEEKERKIPSLGCESTACWRGYVAWWELRNDSLFLIKIEGCCKNENAVYQTLDLEFLFGEAVVNKAVFANWVSFTLPHPYGKLLRYEHSGYASLYAYEQYFHFEQGILQKIEQFDNTKTKESLYATNHDSLLHFLYNTIRWEDLPPLKDSERKRVIVGFKTDSLGKAIKIVVRRGINPIYDQEAVRVVQQIPAWSVYYKRGKMVSMSWHLPITFDQKRYLMSLDLEEK